MQNALDIMAMVQKVSMPKQTFDVPSKNPGREEVSFKKELIAARNEASRSNSQKTTENKAVNRDPAMTNANKADIKEKPELKAMSKANASTAKVDKESSGQPENVETLNVETLEEDKTSENAVQNLLAVLQQMLQETKNLNDEGSSDLNTFAMEAELKKLVQSIEDLLATSASKQPGELTKALISLQSDLAELLEQFTMKPELQLEAAKAEELIGSLLDKLNQAKTQMHQMLQQPENTEVNIEALSEQVKEAAKVQDKAVKVDNIKPEAAQENTEPTVVNASAENSKSEMKENNSSSHEGEENPYNSEMKKGTEQIVLVDKHTANVIQDAPAVQTDKPNFQLQIKQMTASHSKDSLVKINKADIINQIVKKADVIVQGSHQEMIMKLEPESLGKLNLRLVVENGLLTAKFVAESQQVKEVIETSFNQLKDALSEKGIILQSFSVSVGHEDAEFKSSQGFEQWRKRIKVSSRISGEYLGLDDEINIQGNPYTYHDGKVDYRA